MILEKTATPTLFRQAEEKTRNIFKTRVPALESILAD
jgi:hypothetical protein